MRDQASLLCDDCSPSETFDKVCGGDVEGAIDTAAGVELKLAMMRWGKAWGEASERSDSKSNIRLPHIAAPYSSLRSSPRSSQLRVGEV